MPKSKKEHKISSKSNSQNKSEKNIHPDYDGSDFNNKNNVKYENKPKF